MISAFQIKSYLHYWLEAVDAHSLHSPFYFDLYEKVVQGKDEVDFSRNEKLRKKLLDNPTPLLIETDPGAGPASKNRERTIKEIARATLSPSKFSRLYARLAQYIFARNIIELGTSFGINTLYLAVEKKSKVTTFEGAAPVAAVARSTFEFANASNISLVDGNLDSTLSSWLEQHDKIDLAFMDANHRYAPTIKYFHLIQKRTHFKSVIIMDDIHYTAEMEKAWNEIKADPLVYGTVDLYRSGLIFFDPSLNKQHVVLQF
jgi:predicted O-methyltransferase YrrM